MTAHDLFALADMLATNAAPTQSPANSPLSVSVFEERNASAELVHLLPSQGVPWHRHLHGEDIFFGLRGHAVVRVVEPDSRIVDHDLMHGALVVVPADTPHTVVLDSPSASYLLLQAPGDESDFHHEAAPDQTARTSQ